MRPKSIVTFERLALLSLAIAVITTLLNWDRTAAAFRTSGFGTAIPLISTILEFGIGLALILLISRKGNGIAKWILAVLTAAGVVELAIRAARGGFGGGWMDLAEVAKMLLLAIAVWLLFRADAKPWFVRAEGERQPVQ